METKHTVVCGCCGTGKLAVTIGDAGPHWGDCPNCGKSPLSMEPATHAELMAAHDAQQDPNAVGSLCALDPLCYEKPIPCPHHVERPAGLGEPERRPIADEVFGNAIHAYNEAHDALLATHPDSPEPHRAGIRAALESALPRGLPVVPNGDDGHEHAHRLGVLVYGIDFGDEGMGYYVRLRDFKQVCERGLPAGSDALPSYLTADSPVPDDFRNSSSAYIAGWNDCREARRSTAEQPSCGQDARDAWQPIETAPKDGRTLLLGRFNEFGKWRTMRGQWMADDYIAEHWEDPEGVEAGWFEDAVEAEDIPNCWPIEPTHWMPLPKAPAAIAAQQQQGGA